MTGERQKTSERWEEMGGSDWSERWRDEVMHRWGIQDEEVEDRLADLKLNDRRGRKWKRWGGGRERERGYVRKRLLFHQYFIVKKVEQRERERWGRESERKMEKKNEGTCTSEPVIPAGHEFNLVQTGFHTQTKSPKLNNEARRLSWPSKTVRVSIVIWPHRLRKNTFHEIVTRMMHMTILWSTTADG